MNVKLCSPGLLSSSWWWFLPDVLGQRIGPICKGQDIILHWCWNLNSNFCKDGGVLNLKCLTMPVTWRFKDHTDTGIECLCVVVEYCHICVWCDADARSQRADLSGGDSPLTAGSPENSGFIERRFADEPLYQFYTAAVVEVSYSRCEACTTLDCVMDFVPCNAS